MIRPAGAGDASAIAALWNWVIRDTTFTFTTLEKTDAEIVALLQLRPDASFVVETDAGFAGFVTFGPFRGGPGYAATVEHSIILAPHAQGQGLGTALITRAEAAAQARGAHVMVAAISGENTGACAFHAAIGFDEVGRMPQVGRKAGRWLDLVLMQKIL